MKRILQKFLDQFIEMLALAIDRGIDKKLQNTKIKVIEQKTIDELLRVFHHTVLKRDGYTTTITYDNCNRYSIVIKNSDGVLFETSGLKDIRMVCEATLGSLMEKVMPEKV